MVLWRVLLAGGLFALGSVTWADPVRAQISESPFQLVKTASSRALLEEGRAQLLDLRVQAAEQAFRQLAQRPDGQEAAHMHLASAALIRTFLTDDDAHLESFWTWSDRWGETLEECPGDHWCRYLEGERQLQRALAYAKQERTLRAAWAARSAYRHYDRALEGRERFYEPYKGMGLFHLVIGSLPDTYRRAAELVGYRGSIPGGLRELRLAEDSSRFHREEAGLLRALITAGPGGRPQAGLRLMHHVQEEHAASPLFRYLEGLLQLLARQTPQAERSFRATRRVLQETSRQSIVYLDLYLGEALFRQQNYEAAIRALRRFLEVYPGEKLVARAQLRLGLALEMRRGHEVARPHYRRAREAAKEEEIFVYEQRAARRADRPMTQLERELLRGRNLYDAGEEAQAISALQAVYQATEAPQVVRNEAAYRLGLAYMAQERYDEALRCFRYAVRQRADEQAKWAPWSQFHIGEVYRERGQSEKARQAFQAAADYDEPFSFHQGLDQRVRFERACLEGDCAFTP